MQTLLNSILDSIPEDANFLTFFLFFSLASFVYCLSQANVIYDFFEKVNKREILKLKDLLADENISEKAKRTIRNKIDSIIYNKITGISSEKYLQEKIINYHELSEGKLRYSDFKKAKSFLKIERDGRLNIRTPNIFERILQIYWIFMSGMVFLFICLLLFALVYATISIREQITLLLLIIFFVFVLMFFISQVVVIPTVKKIKDEIENNSLIIQSNNALRERKRNNLKEKKLRPFGLCEGEFTVPDDFDDPLPEDILNTFEDK